MAIIHHDDSVSQDLFYGVKGKASNHALFGSHAFCLALVVWKKARQLGIFLGPKQAFRLVRPSFANRYLMKTKYWDKAWQAVKLSPFWVYAICCVFIMSLKGMADNA